MFKKNGIEKEFTLLKRIMQSNNGSSILSGFSELDRIVWKDIRLIVNRYPSTDILEKYTEFKRYYDNLKTMLLYGGISNKRIIALGGGFSSGKSSFMNALIKDDILPADIKPTTSVPAYISFGTSNSAIAINMVNNKVDLSLEDIKILSHGYGKTQFDTTEIPLGTILKSIHISVKKFPFENIAFLDTPGYSKEVSNNYGEQTDMSIARSQLNEANVIMWFVTADNGTITKNDIEFIKNLDKNIPKIIVVSKADKIPPYELSEVVRNIAENLEKSGVKYQDILTFSAHNMEQYDGKKILGLIKELNDNVSGPNYILLLKRVLKEIGSLLDNQISNEKLIHGNLSKILAKIYDKEIDNSEYLEFLDKSSVQQIHKLKMIRKDFNNAQTEFWEYMDKVIKHYHICNTHECDENYNYDFSLMLLECLKEAKLGNTKGNCLGISEIINSILRDIEVVDFEEFDNIEKEKKIKRLQGILEVGK